MKDWVPVFTSLVWPVFIIAVLLLYREQAGSLFSTVEQAIKEGRSVAIADILKLGEKTTIGQLKSEQAGGGAVNVDLSISSVGGHAELVHKGSRRLLEVLKTQLQASPADRIDVMVLSGGREYSVKLLNLYITSLGIRFVVFEEDDQFRGWIGASLFNSQLSFGPAPDSEDEWKSYDALRSGLVGISQRSVPPEMPAIAVLRVMEAEDLENIPIVRDGKFQFIANRERLMSKLLTATIFKVEEKAAVQ